MKKAYLISVFISLVYFFGCEITTRSQSEDIIPLNGKVRVLIEEVHLSSQLVRQPGDIQVYSPPSGTPSPVILLETEQMYPSFGYGIRLDVSVTGERIDLTIYGVDPSRAEQADHSSPARSVVDLGLESGRFDLFIHTPRGMDTYDLAITSDRIILEPVQTNHTEPVERFIWRYPPLSMGLFGNSHDTTGELFEEFDAMLLNELSLQPFHEPAEGVWPYFRYVPKEQFPFRRYYTYSNESDFQRIQELLINFGDEYMQHIDGAMLHIRNWQNFFGFYPIIIFAVP
jgi:hypothetical protein